MGRSKNKEPSQRQLRVGEEVRHALSAIFERGNFRDPILINTIITVTEVRVTPDLRCGRVFIVPLGGKNTEEVLKSLTRCKSYLRKEIGKRLQLRSIPNLFQNLRDNSGHFPYYRELQLPYLLNQVP